MTIISLIAAPARADFIDLWADKGDMPSDKAPRWGRSRLLLIPVQIDYTGPKGAYPPLDLDGLKRFFTAPAASDVASFQGYVGIASSGRYRPEVTVAPLVRYDGCPSMLAASADCGIPRGEVASLTPGMDFVRDVFRRVHDEGKVDFSQFDVNGPGGLPDGVADGVMMVVNVPRVGIALPIEFINTGSNLAGGFGGALILDGVKVPYVAIGGSSTASGKPRFEFVVLHEFGHLLGLADLYYEHPSSGDPYPNFQGLHFSLMGDYGYDEACPLPDAESRRALNWQESRLVSGTQTLTLLPAAEGGFAVKLGQMSGARKEYFLAEARGPAGAYDRLADGAGAPAWGLALYHVDWSRGPKAEQGAWVQRLLSCLDCDPFHPFVRNLESSNQWGLVFAGPMRPTSAGSRAGIADDRVLFATGSIGSLENAGPLSKTNLYTATNYYDGTPSGIRIDDIVVNADHSVTATFTAPAVADPCADVVCAPREQCVRSGPRAGNCDALGDPSADAGMPAVGTVNSTTPAASGGCSSGGAVSMLALLGAALLLRRSRSPAGPDRSVQCASRSPHFLNSASSAAFARAAGSSGGAGASAGLPPKSASSADRALAL